MNPMLNIIYTNTIQIQNPSFYNKDIGGMLRVVIKNSPL